MHLPRRPLPVLGLAAALTLGLVSLGPVSPVAADDGAATDAPTRSAAAAPASRTSHAVPLSQATLLRTNARKTKWPVRQRIATTYADTTPHASAKKAQKLKSATIVQDLVKGTVSADVRLRAKPSAASDSMVIVALGKITADGNWCQSPGETTIYWYAYGTDGQSAPGLLRNGARMQLLHFPAAMAKKDQFECAFAETWRVEDEGEDPYQVLFDGRGTFRLKATLDKPKLKITAPKKTKAKVNRWQKVKVKVRNGNPRVAAPAVKVRVNGKAVQTKVAKLGKLRPGKQGAVKVKFRVRPGHTGKAKIAVKTKNVTRKKAIRLR